MSREIGTEVEEVIYRAISPRHLGGLTLSPDGRWLAFLTSVLEDDAWTQVLTLMPSSGGATRELARFEKPYAMKIGDWTADGEAFLFVRYREAEEGDRELWRVPLTLREPEPLGFTAKGLREVRARPGGGSIAFTTGWPDYSLWVMEQFLSEGS